MIEINDANGPEALQKERNYLLMFYTDWCPLCPPLSKALDALQQGRDADFAFAKINYDENPEAVAFFRPIGVPFVFAIQEKNVIGGWGGLVDGEAYEKIADIAFSPPGKALTQQELDALNAIGEEYGMEDG